VCKSNSDKNKCVCLLLPPALQAEEQLKLVEDQRKILEERQRLEDTERSRVRQEQEVILNKKNARPRLSFSLGKTSWDWHWWAFRTECDTVPQMWSITAVLQCMVCVTWAMSQKWPIFGRVGRETLNWHWYEPPRCTNIGRYSPIKCRPQYMFSLLFIYIPFAADGCVRKGILPVASCSINPQWFAFGRPGLGWPAFTLAS